MIHILLPKPRDFYRNLPRGLRGLFGEEEQRYYNVVAVQRRAESGLYLVHRAHNIVTDAGDVHLAQMASAATPTNRWDQTANSCLYMRSDTASPGKSTTYSATNAVAPTTGKAASVIEANNLDADNTGKGTEVTTRKWSCTTGEFNNGTLTGNYIAVASASGGAAVYATWDWSPTVNKTSSDTLTVWHNSDFEGS